MLSACNEISVALERRYFSFLQFKKSENIGCI